MDKITAEMLRQQRAPIVVIYERPLDYPDQYAARVFDLNRPTELFVLADNLDEIRAKIPTEILFQLPPDPRDEPHIKEVWI